MYFKLLFCLGSAASLLACTDSVGTTAIVETESVATATSGRPVISVVDTAPMRTEFDSSRSLRENVVNGALPPTYARIVASSDPSGEVGEDFAGVTLFVPTEEALREMDPQDTAFLLDPEQRDAAYGFYADSALHGRISARTLAEAMGATQGGTFDAMTLSGETITFHIDGGELVVGNASGETARVVEPDLATTDGVVHYIDNVLWVRS